MLSKQQPSGSAKHTKTMLSIEQKLKVLDYAKENPKESCRTLSTKFSVGKTQIATILKTRLNYVPRTLHIVEITLEITNVLVKVDIRRSIKLCTNGIHWEENLLFLSMDQCSRKKQLKLRNS